jgi:soluble lytic murein transglycosylase
MPRVPTYDSFQVMPNTAPTNYFHTPNLHAEQVGKQAEQIGQAMTGMGDAFAKTALDMAQEANQLRVDDATNQLREAALQLKFGQNPGQAPQPGQIAGYTQLKGADALYRPDGTALSEEYGNKLQEHISKISEGLGNDAQRAAFTRFANGYNAGFRADVSAHEIGEFRDYSLSVADGIQKTAMNDIALNYNNPAAIQDAVGRIQAETYRQAKILGKSAEWQEASARSLTSSAHKLAISTALENNNPLYAEDYLKRFSTQMNADDILSVRGHITKDVDNRIGSSVANEVLQKVQPQIAPGDAERAYRVGVWKESRNKQFDKNGAPLTSSAGAVGIGQVMPGTGPEAAKLAGLPWDENAFKYDEKYNYAIGLAYFQKQLQDNGGELDKAYAAYNAGPGALKEAVKKAEKEGGNWLANLPQETQKYVIENVKNYNAGGGAPPRPTFAEIDAQLRADPRIANNPQRYKIARDQASIQFEDQTKAIKQREEEGTATAIKGLIQNGGRFSDLPSDVIANIPPKEYDSVLSTAKKIALGDDHTNLALYNKLTLDPTKDPVTGQAMSDSQFMRYRSELSESDFKHFSNERAKVGKPDSPTDPASVNMEAVNSTLNYTLNMLKIDPTPKDGTADGQRVGAIRKTVVQAIIAQQASAGKKFSQAEVVEHVNALFAKNQTVKGLISGYSGSMLGMKTSDLPSGTVKEIKTALKLQGNEDPNDAQILQHYWITQFTKR